MSDTTITFLILAAVVAVFVWDYLPIAIVAIGVSLSLWATGVLDLHQALAGFGDPGPGGYRFGDYWKLGLPLVGLFGLVAVLLVPVFWSF